MSGVQVGDGGWLGARRGVAALAAALLLLAAAGPAGASDRFTDVPDGNPFHGEIAWLVDAGIATGWPDGTFRPGVAVSRQAMAAFLQRLFVHLGGEVGAPADPGLVDVPVDHPFAEEIWWLVESGISTGWPDGTFRHGEPVSRQAMAAFLQRLAELVPTPLDLVVDAAHDAPDAAPGDGTCDDGTGACTLRAAIDEVNAGAAPPGSVIRLAVDPVLGLAGADEDANATGDLDVHQGVVVEGQGHVVDAAQLDRAIDHHAGALVLRDVTVTGGWVEVGALEGGGIRTAGALRVEGAVVEGNRVLGDGGAGGGISGSPGATIAVVDSLVVRNRATAVYPSAAQVGGGIAARGPVDVERSTVFGNRVHTSGDGSGGGIHVLGGPLRVVDSDVRANVAGVAGGGVLVDHGAAIEGSTLAANRATDGGAVHGPAEISRSTLAGNLADRGGGTYGAAHLVESTVQGNTAAISGGGTFGSATVERSTLVGNEAIVGGGSYGNVAISSSTISGNRASSGAAVAGHSTFALRSSTVVGNGSSTAPDPASSLEVVVGDLVSATITATVVAPLAGDEACARPIGSGGWNVVGDASCSLAGPGDAEEAATDVTVVPLPLGGPTPTTRLLASSAAVDRIPAGTPGACDGSTGPDQRGVARSGAAPCDAGAVEGPDGSAAAPLALVVDDAGDGVDVAPGDGACAAASGACTLRAAVDEANAYPTADAITVADGVDPVLGLAGATEDRNATGDLDVLDDVVIDGGGATVDAAGLDRALDLGSVVVAVQDLVVTGGAAPSLEGGGGVASRAELSLDGVRLAGNDGPRGGGGLHQLGGSLVAVDTAVVDNHSRLRGGGVKVQGSSSAHLERVLLAGNVVDGAISCGTSYGTCFDGAALDLHSTTATVVASTITGNAAAGEGAISLYGSDLDITASTVVDGTATTWSVLVTYGASTVEVAGSVLGGPGESCQSPVTSLGWNLGGVGCGLSAPTDTTGTDPDLEPLADHGGATPVRLPRSTSPLVDAVAAGTAGLCDGTQAPDQRSVARPVGGGCDVGAVERTVGDP